MKGIKANKQYKTKVSLDPVDQFYYLKTGI